jgi:CRISPR/Cas system CMR-associated protein Cmr5 small subunit
MRLEQIFNEFSDDKAKIQFLLQLQHNDVPKAFASRAMEFLIEKGYQREAAVFAEKAGRIDDAIQLHIEREAFNAAGEVAERHNRDAKELYNMHIDEEIREGSEWYYIRNYAKEKVYSEEQLRCMRKVLKKKLYAKEKQSISRTGQVWQRNTGCQMQEECIQIQVFSMNCWQKRKMMDIGLIHIIGMQLGWLEKQKMGTESVNLQERFLKC